jgi:branched-chain amino acid transport system substrate-binding protein
VTTTPVRLAAAVAAAAALAAVAGHAQARSTAGPIKIGISLSLSGDFSDSGKAAERGYKLWANTVNAHGGVLGRQVQLVIQDDTSSPTQAQTNYQTFITKDKVDLVFGPFSTLLTAPAARVAARYGYPFIEPAGGGPAVFQEKLHNVFFTQPAPVLQSGDVFAKFLLSLPKSERPTTAAYPSLDDPFSSPIADHVRSLLSKAGIRTVFKTIYPAETTDMTPIVQKMIAS